MHKVYPKIRRLGLSEVEGILVGKVYIQEKVDGANASAWLENGKLKLGSRKRDITDEDFRGFRDHMFKHEGIKKLLKDNPNYRIFGEWLVKHTLNYSPIAYGQFYMFDIMVDDKEEFLKLNEVEELAKKYDINIPEIFAVLENPSKEDVDKYVGKSVIGEEGEGVVLKNYDFVNKFGNMRYAKVVTQKFKEDNSLVFGGNNKHSETYWETYVMNKWMTPARVAKIAHKVKDDTGEDFDYRFIPRISGEAYHDMITEESWEIAKKVGSIDFKQLKRICTKKAVLIYKAMIEGLPYEAGINMDSNEEER